MFIYFCHQRDIGNELASVIDRFRDFAPLLSCIRVVLTTDEKAGRLIMRV